MPAPFKIVSPDGAERVTKLELEEAIPLMRSMAEGAPGKYKLYRVLDDELIATVDTRPASRRVVEYAEPLPAADRKKQTQWLHRRPKTQKGGRRATASR